MVISATHDNFIWQCNASSSPTPPHTRSVSIVINWPSFMYRVYGAGKGETLLIGQWMAHHEPNNNPSLPINLSQLLSRAALQG